MSLMAFFQWCEASALGSGIRNSVWLFPAIEAVHLLGLAMMGGFVLIVDMRLLGWGLRRQPVARLATAVEPWLIASLVVMLISGVLLATSESTKLYENAPFWVKMGFLAAAILYTFTIRRRVLAAGDGRVGRLASLVVALVSIALWAGVGVGGRAIGFY
jgi:low affinity Fe/Cu permease